MNEEKAIFTFLNPTKQTYSIMNFKSGSESLKSLAQINLNLAHIIIKSVFSLKDVYLLKESYLNKIDLKAYSQLTKFIIELLTEDLKEALYKIILMSKTTDLINLASSNSITLLNKSGFSFNNKDLTNIKVPYSDLSYGVFINSNFESSNLSGANFSMSSIFDSNFENCNMIEADFGEKILAEDLIAHLLFFSPCGKFLAIASGNVILLYESKTYKEVARFCGHDKSLISLQFSDNSNYLISCSDDRIILWDCYSQLQIDQFPEFENYSSFSLCSKYLCLVLGNQRTSENIIKIYSINERKMINEIRFDYWFTLVAFSDWWQNMVILSKDSALSIWNWTTGIEISKIFCWHFDPVIISPDRKYLVIHYCQNTIAIISIEKLEIIMKMRSNAYPHFFRFSICGRYLVLVSEIRGIEFFDLILQLKIFDFNGKAKWFSESLTISPIEKYLIMGTSDKKLKLWKIQPKNEAFKFILAEQHIKTVSFSNDSQYFAVATEEGWIFIYLTENQKLINHFQAHSNEISCISWSGSILASASGDCFIKIWNIYDEFPLKVIKTNLKSHWIEFSPDSRKILSLDALNFITIWDIDKDMAIAYWIAHYDYDYDYAYMARWSPCQNFLVICCSDWSIKVWRIDSQELITKLTRHSDSVHFANFSNCGKFLISSSIDQYIKIWYIADMEKDAKEVKVIKEFYVEKPINSAVWFNGGENIIGSNKEGQIVIWDYNTGKIALQINAHKDHVVSFDLSKNEHFLISSGRDLALKLWKFEKIKTIIK